MGNRACVPTAMLCNRRNGHSEKPTHHNKEQPLHTASYRKARAATKTQPGQTEINENYLKVK